MLLLLQLLLLSFQSVESAETNNGINNKVDLFNIHTTLPSNVSNKKLLKD